MDESPGSDREQRLLSDLSEHASIDLLDSVINDVAPEVNNGRQFNSLMRILVILNIQNARKDGNSESYLPPGAFGKSPKDYDDPSARKEIISIWKRHVQDLKLNRPK